MLKRLHLQNFKSYRHSDPIELGRINVLAGANSSGKSSIIQSLLLLKQTVQYGASARTLALNGPLLRLGAFDDVKNNKSGNENFEIGLEFEFQDNQIRGRAYEKWFRTLRRHTATSPSVGGLNLHLTYADSAKVIGIQGVTVGAPSLHPVLTRTSLCVISERTGDERHISSVELQLNTTEKVDEEGFRPPYVVHLDQGSASEIFADKPDPVIKGAHVQHFLPSWIAVEYNENKYEAGRMAERLFSNSLAVFGLGSSQEKLSKKVSEIINGWLSEHSSEAFIATDGSATVKDAQAALDVFTRRQSPYLPRIMIRPEPSKELRAELDQLKEAVRATLIDEGEDDTAIDFSTPQAIEGAANFLQEFLKQELRYLGPLRDSPRPVYQPEALESTDDVGYRGEHTAAILDLNGSRMVSYRPPPGPSLDEPYPEGVESKIATLHDAVVEWLTYLGVAGEVKTTDAGVYGNRLQVTTQDSPELHDLTNVGVGVSQVLPIVVMALLASRGSMLIFEQPELHLHPKVQSRLADFFLSLAMNDKQMLLETHSEYMIDRFRLRIAVSNENIVRDAINILFSEISDGVTSLTPVEISEYGAIVNWPKDFFEHSQKDISKIIEAATKKRRLSRG